MLVPIALCFTALLQGLAALGSPLVVAPHNDAGSTAVSQTATDRPTAVSQIVTDRPTAVSQIVTDRPTAVSQIVTDRPTAVSQIVTDRPTAVSQIVTDRPTAVSQIVTDRPTAVSQIVTDRPTAVSQIVTDRPTAVSQIVTDRPTAVSQIVTDRPTAVSQIVTERPTAVSQIVTERPTAVSQTAIERPTAVSQTAIERPTTSSTTGTIIHVAASQAMQPINSTEITPSLTQAMTATSTLAEIAASSLQSVTIASSDVLRHSVTPQDMLSSALNSLPSTNKRQNDSVIFMSATVPMSEGTTAGTQSEVLMTSAFTVTKAVLSTSGGTYHSGDSITYQGFSSSTQPPVSLADSTPSPHVITSSGILQTSSQFPPVAVSSSTPTPSHISLDTENVDTILSPSLTERLPRETETPHWESLLSISSTGSIPKATALIVTSPIISPVSEPSPHVQTLSALDKTIRTSPTQTFSNTVSLSAGSNDSTERNQSENGNQFQSPDEDAIPNVWSQSIAISSTEMFPSSPLSVWQYSSSAQISSSGPEGVTGMDGSSGPLPATEGGEGGVEEERSEGRHLSPGQKTALGICLTVVSMALVFAGFVIYKRRTQIGRWKLLDKSLRYRYWSYTHDCHQDDDIL